MSGLLQQAESQLFRGKGLLYSLEKLPRCHDRYETRITLQLIPQDSATFTRKKGFTFELSLPLDDSSPESSFYPR